MSEDKELENFIKTQTFITREFIEEGYKFWFNDNNEIRSPFPIEIQDKLKEVSFENFMKWIFELSDNERENLPDEELVEMFEVTLFNEGMKLVENTDQQLTISYPFLPRIGDKVNDKENGESIVITREVVNEKDKKNYLKLTLEKVKDKERWDSGLPLPN